MLSNGYLNRGIFSIGSIEYDEKIYRRMQTCGLQKNMTKKELKESADSAIGLYITKDSTNFRFMHDSLEETIGCHFYKFDSRVMFSECDILFIRDRLRVHSIENTNTNIHENIVIIQEDELNEDRFEPFRNKKLDDE